VFRKTVNLQTNTNTFEASLNPWNHIDHQWTVLQGTPRWRATAPLLGKQHKGYSDITRKVENYKV
jgi:hypothetical protein